MALIGVLLRTEKHRPELLRQSRHLFDTFLVHHPLGSFSTQLIPQKPVINPFFSHGSFERFPVEMGNKTRIGAGTYIHHQLNPVLSKKRQKLF